VCTLDFTLGPPDGRSNTSAAAELAEFRKITTFKKKNTIFNEHPVVVCKYVLISNNVFANFIILTGNFGYKFWKTMFILLFEILILFYFVVFQQK